MQVEEAVAVRVEDGVTAQVEDEVATQVEEVAIRVESDGCRVREILERVADKWSLYVVSMLGGGSMRFTELKRGIDGISQRMLTVTLRNLERDGIVVRTV